mgnify:CR=1 FL=1
MSVAEKLALTDRPPRFSAEKLATLWNESSPPSLFFWSHAPPKKGSLTESVRIGNGLNVFIYLLQLKKGGVAKAKGEGEKEKECTTECKSRRRRDEKAPWALNYESGEGGGDTKGRRRGGEKRAMYV